MKAAVENLEQAAVAQQCRALRLPAVAEQCVPLADAAAKQRQTYLRYLEVLLAAELEERERNTIARRIKDARLPRMKTLEEFDFSKAPQVPATKMHDLAQGGYIERAEPVILIGDCGTGKTHLLTGLCVAACRQKRRVRFATAAALVNELVEAKQQLQLRRVLARWERYDVIAIDEVGYVPMAYPYAYEYSSELRGVVLLDANIPGVTLQPTITLGPDNWRNWHFLFNPIPDLPEALLQGRERILIEWFFNRKAVNPTATFSREDIDEYERVYASLGGMRGMLGYYRAVLEDMKQNSELANHPLEVPVLALGGEAGSAPDLHESLQPFCTNIQGGVIKNSGHYIPEEQPEALAREIIAFLKTLEA